MDERTKENINRDFINRLGISYDEFDKLDFDEQQRLLSEYHKKHPNKSKESLVIIGGGDQSIFMSVPKGKKIWTPNGYFIAGETLEENKKRWEQQMKEPSIKVGISSATSFIRIFIDKLKSGELKIETLPQFETGEDLTEEYIEEQVDNYKKMLDTGIIDEVTKEEQGPVKKLVPNKK